MLRCVTCYFNINNSTKVKENFIEFRKKFNAPLTIVELQFNDQPFWIEDAIQVRGDQSNLMWQKERLINIGIESLPSKVDKVAWIDGDIIFEDLNWFKNTENLLDKVPVTQLFQSVYELNTTNDPVNNGFGYAYQKITMPSVQNAKYGLAWAANRSIIPNGINDFSIAGASDVYQALAWTGEWENEYYGLIGDKHRKELYEKGFGNFISTQGNIGYVKGNIQHLSHGSLKNRKYKHNQLILKNYDFSIEEDIHLDHNLLWQWRSDKPLLKEAIADIFYNRNEDE